MSCNHTCHSHLATITTITTTSTSTRNSSRHIRQNPQPLTLELRLAYQAQSKPPNIIKPLFNHVKTFPLTDTPSSNPESRFSPPRSFQFLARTTETGFPCFLTSKTEYKHPILLSKLAANISSTL
ncbi:hypothetical protein GQ457_17G012180 [Hibiscus cannabinus]